MAEMNELAGRIEKLIVDGQKDMARQIDQKFEEFKQDVINEVDNKLRQNKEEIVRKIDRLDKKHDINHRAVYGLLQDTNDEVNKIGTRLDDHARQPHLA